MSSPNLTIKTSTTVNTQKRKKIISHASIINQLFFMVTKCDEVGVKLLIPIKTMTQSHILGVLILLKPTGQTQCVECYVPALMWFFR